MLEAFANAVLNLKKSVLGFEQFIKKIDDLSDDEELPLEGTKSNEKEVPLFKIQQKLFVDEFFSLEPPG